jgi:hypothetical protein
MRIEDSELKLIMIKILINSDKRMIILKSVLISDCLVEDIIEYLVFNLNGVDRIIEIDIGRSLNIVIDRSKLERQFIESVMIEKFRNNSQKILMLNSFEWNSYYFLIILHQFLR